MITAQDIAASLRARSIGKGRWVAKCIAHEDKKPSLAITEGDNGKILVLCRAGCPQEAVIQALRDRGLWDTKEPRDQVIPWEAPMPSPLPAHAATELLDMMVYEASQVGDDITFARVKALMDWASQVSFHTFDQVGRALSAQSYPAHYFVQRYVKEHGLDKLHEPRP